ncbi:CHAD domain-containing protein [Roseimaritima ulvae]|uniref:CHAD domain protein n=1 Tax=Roseimaritima ulvae TaxID=980254 RepID=A0A5B9QW27_9BACT|nr:CHAD domain-containing protein [Roseimaritima ulvae]QEG42099.1 CHAD domain protein [Roseimaritima ulvae]
MPYQIKRSESVQHAVRRIAREQLTKAIAEIDDSLLDRHKVIHQVRKRCKKLRGLIRLVRPALGKTYGRENDALRDAAGLLSDLRDASVQIEVYDQLLAQYASPAQREACKEIRQQLARRRERIEGGEIDRCLAEFRQRISAARARSSKWKLTASGFNALSGGLGKTHTRARSSLQAVLEDTTTITLHEWRKRIKYHGYHVRLLKGICPELLKPYGQVLDRLGEALGDDHNIAVLQDTIADMATHRSHQHEIEAFGKVLRRRRKKLQRAAIPRGQRVFAEPTTAFVKRLHKYWKL